MTEPTYNAYLATSHFTKLGKDPPPPVTARANQDGTITAVVDGETHVIPGPDLTEPLADGWHLTGDHDGKLHLVHEDGRSVEVPVDGSEGTTGNTLPTDPVQVTGNTLPTDPE